MPNDPLTTLVKVRQRARDEAQRALVDALESEDRAEQACHQLERRISQETEAATDVNGSDAMVEAFVAWLPAARRELAHHRQILLNRQAETMRTRAELTACRTALETVETLVSQRKEAARHALDLIYARDLEDRPFRTDTFDDVSET